MAVISHIGFASTKRLPTRMIEKFRKTWVTHAVFILEDETLGALVLHAEQGHRVSTLSEFEKEHLLVGVIQPKIQLGPTLSAVMDERRGGKKFATCSELVCEVIRRGHYPGSFGLRENSTAQDLYAFLQRPPPVSREAVRLFSSSSGGKTPNQSES